MIVQRVIPIHNWKVDEPIGASELAPRHYDRWTGLLVFHFHCKEHFLLICMQFAFAFPASLPRSVGALRFTSFISSVLSFYVVLAIMFLCLVDRDVTPDLGNSFKAGFQNFNITTLGVFTSIPKVIFAYMY